MIFETKFPQTHCPLVSGCFGRKGSERERETRGRSLARQSIKLRSERSALFFLLDRKMRAEGLLTDRATDNDHQRASRHSGGQRALKPCPADRPPTLGRMALLWIRIQRAHTDGCAVGGMGFGIIPRHGIKKDQVITALASFFLILSC